jgi:glycerophosphoryl diester phosphodiesterase
MKGTKVLVLLVLGLVALEVRPADAHRHRRGTVAELGGTVEELLELDAKPFAIAHRGFGDNLGQDRTRPIENTVEAVRQGFGAGASIVEIDVQLTRDGRVAVFHDDFLDDFTCLNALTFAELERRVPWVPTLEAVLREARRFDQASGPLRGLVIIELKAAAPLCDRHDRQEHAIVNEVSRVVHEMGMTRQVMFTSFSPALLFLASHHAPAITRILSISGLQLLSAPEITKVLGYPVTLIDKRLDLGLQWAEIGPIFRLPGYRSVGEVLATALTVQARVVEADLFFLRSAGAPFVEAVHGLGLEAFGFTATNAQEWFFLESLGLDGIYTSDVPFGVAHQAPIP